KYREQERCAIHLDRTKEGDADVVERAQIVNRCEGQRQPENRPAGGQDETLGQHLENQARAAGSERGANGELLPSRCGAGEQKIRQIRAGDEQDGSDGAEQHEQPSAEAAGQMIAQSGQSRAESPHFGMRAPELVVDYLELRLGLSETHARLETAEHGERVAPTICLRSERKGDKHVDAGAGSENGAEVE